MHMKKNIFRLSLLFFISFTLSAFGQQTDTLSVRSRAMNKEIKNIIVLPEQYGTDTITRWPVVYLLHGYGGNYTTWLHIKPELPRIASEKGIIFICPDGKNSWYWDIPGDRNYQYETYITKELVPYVDCYYRTKTDRTGRAITGLSMGGHGAFWLAIGHQDLFGAAGSTSGGLDIRPFPENWDMKKHLGDYKNHQENWDTHTVATQADKLSDGLLALIFDCGADDFFLNVNKAFHQELTDRKIAHDFIVRPGAHNNQYWNNSIDYQLLFFSKFFQSHSTDRP